MFFSCSFWYFTLMKVFSLLHLLNISPFLLILLISMFYLILGYLISDYNMNKRTHDWVLLSFPYSISWVLYCYFFYICLIFQSWAGIPGISHVLHHQVPSRKDLVSAAEGMFGNFPSQIKTHSHTCCNRTRTAPGENNKDVAPAALMQAIAANLEF